MTGVVAQAAPCTSVSPLPGVHVNAVFCETDPRLPEPDRFIGLALLEQCIGARGALRLTGQFAAMLLPGVPGGITHRG